MFRKRKLLAKVLLLALIFGYAIISSNGDKPSRFGIPHAKAGAITSPTWAASSSTLGATSVTFTHTFTTATAIPATTGRVEIQINTMGGQPPDFWNATLGSNTTTALKNQRMEIYPEGDGSLILAIQNGSTAVPAGTVTLEFTGMTNPTQGGSWSTNTYTLNNGSALDGKKGPDNNASINVGTASLTVNVSYNSQPVAGYPLEVHPQSCCGMWRATSNALGDATFYGITDGTFVLETSHGVDPNSETAKNVTNVYMQIEPQNITIPATQTINLVLQRSNKIIEVTVKYADTGAAIQGANVNAFSNGGGGFAFAQTNSSGVAQLRVSVQGEKSNLMVSAMPQFAPPPGQGQQQQQAPAEFVAKPPMPISFNKAAAEAETVSLEMLVDRPNATVTGKLINPDGTPASGGAGAQNFRTHSFQPLMVNPTDGSFSFSTSAGTGEWELHRFDPSGQYYVPKTRFAVKKGANSLGTIKLQAFDGSIAVQTYRVDGGSDAALASTPIMAFDTKNPGPPMMSFTGSDGTGTIKVMKGKTYRVMANPGGSGPGMREGGEEGGGKKGGERMGLMEWTISAMAEGPASKPTGAMDANQLFPTTGPQKGSSGDTLTFRFDKATKKITVSTIDGDGNLVSDGNWINARPTGTGGPQFGPGFGGPGAGGQATVYTTTGTFAFNAFYPPNSQYAGKEKSVEITGDTTIQLVVVEKTGTVSGEIQDASNDNVKITGETAKKLNLMVGAFWKGGFSEGSVDTATGTYTVKVPPATDVNVGVAPANAIMGGTSEYIPSMSPKTLTTTDGGTTTHNLTLAKVDATINVTVKDQDGNTIEGVNVFANNKLADIIDEGPGGPRPEGPEGPEFGFSGVTDVNGVVAISVAPDTYNLVTNAREQGLFATETSRVEIKSKESADVTISLVKADASAEIEINKSDGTDLKEASVQIFNDKGTIAFEISDGSEEDKDGTINGAVKFDLPSNKSGDAYSVKAGKDNPENGEVTESGFSKIVVDKGETETLTLTAETKTDSLAKAVTADVSSSSPATVELTKSGAVDASLAIPTGALSSSSSSSSEEGSSSSSSSSATLTVTPMKAEAVSTKADVPIKGISVEAIDGSGNSITTLASQVTGTIHYNDGDIPTGVKEANLVVKAFNEDSGQWESVAASSVDTTTNTVTFATTHLTDFAVVASTDTNAPSAPTNIAVSAGDKKATISWTNSTDSDLTGVKIYRSTTEGSLGSLVKTVDSKTTTSYEDTSLTNGTKYYYTARSYDTAGNISTNTNQVSATPGVLPLTGEEGTLKAIWVKMVNLASNLF
ncbi:MAG: fibronectin type III domain-containing protein [Patescibacteria group bacterium]